jgi:hypothetical protein
LDSATSGAPTPLVEDELVDDRALEAFDADYFGHADFVRELAGIIRRTRTPASIALFGAWGSGKSGIANLLEQELPKKRSDARFVVFDASKYAEAPLRRHFISQVAHGLDIKDSKYHHGLYTGEEDRNVKFRPGEWAKLAGAFLLTVLLTLAVLLLIATFVAAVSTGSFTHNWSGIVKSYLLATLPVAAVITTFVKLAADGFHVKTTRSAPAGDEEFENRFKELVADAGTKRLVIFIDELDRCSPAQVASTLETLKTFLFVPKCVFVVAADQQVLEQALRRKVRQHTPEDASNPYYSAGSSYLDKVFQYQLTLPPLRSPTLSRFALGLVEGRPGVWQRVPSLGEAVSVLIPTHVVSPRRIKVLLNRFAIAFRLAERRAAEGRLDPGFATRAPELAKLVCLQSEFPLFAEDLTLDTRLPELVRMAADREALPANVAPEVAQRAVAYARGDRIVAELLVNTEPAESGDDEREGTSPAAPEADEDGAGVVEDDDRSGDYAVDSRGEAGDGRAPSRGGDVARRHALQLVAYLRKTRYVSGPAADLLYLESAGAGHGVDAVLADRLQRAALDNDIAGVLRLVASATDDGQGVGALLVLADVVRQAQPGVEGRNVVSALLQGIQRSGVELDGHADYIADAVAGHAAEAELAGDDLLGALALARASSREVGPTLFDAVLRHPMATARADVATELLDRAPEVPDELRTRLAIAARTALLGAPEDAAERLLTLPSSEACGLLDLAAAPLKQTSDAHYEAVKAREDEEEFEETSIRGVPPHEALATAYDTVAARRAEETGAGAEKAEALQKELIRLMLTLDHKEYRTAVAAPLGQLAPIEDRDLSAKVLQATQRRVVGPEWPLWLDPLDARAIGEDERLQERVDSLAVHIWKKVTGDEPPSEDDAAVALQALGRCAEHSSIQTDIEAAVREALDSGFTSDAGVASQDIYLQHARRFAEAGVLKRRALADIELNGVAQTLESPVPAAPNIARGTVPAALMARMRDAAADASAEELRLVLQNAPDTAWLSAAERANVQLTMAAALREHDPATPSPLDIPELRELATSVESEASVDDTLSLWLSRFADRPDTAWQVVEPLVDDELPPKTAGALGRFARSLDGADRFALIDQALQRTVDAPVHSSFFEAARLSEVPAHKVAERLGQLFAAAPDETGWRAILNVWQQLSPTGEAARKRLIQEVYLPLIEKGDTGVDLALLYFGLVADVRGVRKSVTAALENAVHTDEQKDRLDKRLLEAKWKRRRFGGLGPTVDRDE